MYYSAIVLIIKLLKALYENQILVESNAIWNRELSKEASDWLEKYK